MSDSLHIYYRSGTITVTGRPDGLVDFKAVVSRRETCQVEVAGKARSVDQACWLIDRALAGEWRPFTSWPGSTESTR